MNYICVRNYLLSWVLKISWWVLSYASSGCSTVTRTWYVVSTILLFSSLNSSIEQIENCSTKFSSVIIVLNSLLSSSRLPYSRYSLRSRGHQFSLPQLNTVLYKNVFVFLIDVCFSIFSSIIPPHCISIFHLIVIFSRHCFVFFFFLLFVLKVRVSPLFIKDYLTWLDMYASSPVSDVTTQQWTAWQSWYGWCRRRASDSRRTGAADSTTRQGRLRRPSTSSRRRCEARILRTRSGTTTSPVCAVQ